MEIKITPLNAIMNLKRKYEIKIEYIIGIFIIGFVIGMIFF